MCLLITRSTALPALDQAPMPIALADETMRAMQDKPEGASPLNATRKTAQEFRLHDESLEPHQRTPEGARS